MTDRLTSDMSFWLKFVRDSNLTANNSTMLKYSMALADRFSNLEEFSAVNENDLQKLGIVNQADRVRLIQQARLMNEKSNQQPFLQRRSTAANRVIGSWLGDDQVTSLNRNSLSKSASNLSPALLSRISFNDRPTSVVYPFAEPANDIRKRNFGHLMEPEEKVLTVDDNGKVRSSTALTASPPLEYQGVLKKTPSTSTHGMRTVKSLSDTISIQKKVPMADRLKRLDSSTSLFQRQTSLISRKVSNLANKLVNPFAMIRKKTEPSLSSTTIVDSQVDLRTNMKRQISLVNDTHNTTVASRRTVTISPLKRSREDDDEDQPIERRKVQMLNVNQEIRRPTGLFSYEDPEPKRNTAPVQTLGSKRFKLGATTSFLTRSLANHGLIE
ncbi:unnamed protein product [Adineta ricciae]|uniref:SAM domain-containing protein n=1 Tax=Adineta ricciae TaxID=249248 RepID=A0A814PZX4_ADIRI|nr:unnamed protein product [Adineta ricciae]CAF1112740.1 unnamed protein product [Adineta ricciae]